MVDDDVDEMFEFCSISGAQLWRGKTNKASLLYRILDVALEQFYLGVALLIK
jgi:hypothetical protein